MSGKLSYVSPRKIAANRQNALKSTGPKTPQGKAYSQRNALKHGLFARDWWDFVTLGEDPEEYEKLLNDLRDQYQPIGRAEELDVERIALCWWRLKRAWRYENAASHIGVRDFARQEIAYQEEYLQKLRTEQGAMLLELRNAKNALELTGGTLPPDLKQRIFAINPKFESIWSGFERIAREESKALITSKKSPELSPEQHSSVESLIILSRVIGFLELEDKITGVGVMENAIARHLIPNGETGDRLLRYETTIERNLGRANDRLERQQRRRKGEAVPPPVSVRLMR
jgi:hypothetical protein